MLQFSWFSGLVKENPKLKAYEFELASKSQPTELLPSWSPNPEIGQNVKTLALMNSRITGCGLKNVVVVQAPLNTAILPDSGRWKSSTKVECFFANGRRYWVRHISVKLKQQCFEMPASEIDVNAGA
jgi:hypothetical protein